MLGRHNAGLFLLLRVLRIMPYTGIMDTTHKQAVKKSKRSQSPVKAIRGKQAHTGDRIKISVFLSRELDDILRVQVAQENISKSKLVAEMLAQHL